VLTFAAFHQHLDGSIVRALARRANATLAWLPYEWEREAFGSVMRRLATAVETESASGSALASVAGAPSSTKIPVTKHRFPASSLLDFPDLRISLSIFRTRSSIG
jgi:hypothetical protein